MAEKQKTPRAALLVKKPGGLLRKNVPGIVPGKRERVKSFATASPPRRSRVRAIRNQELQIINL